jgi:hypothetical protein
MAQEIHGGDEKLFETVLAETLRANSEFSELRLSR